MVLVVGSNCEKSFCVSSFFLFASSWNRLRARETESGISVPVHPDKSEPRFQFTSFLQLPREARRIFFGNPRYERFGNSEFLHWFWSRNNKMSVFDNSRFQFTSFLWAGDFSLPRSCDLRIFSLPRSCDLRIFSLPRSCDLQIFSLPRSCDL